MARTEKRLNGFAIPAEKIENGIVVSYEIDGKEMYHGKIYVFSDADVSAECKNDEITLSKRFEKGENTSMFVLYCDDFDRADYADFLSEKHSEILENPEKVFEKSAREMGGLYEHIRRFIGRQKDLRRIQNRAVSFKNTFNKVVASDGHKQRIVARRVFRV